MKMTRMNYHDGWRITGLPGIDLVQLWRPGQLTRAPEAWSAALDAGWDEDTEEYDHQEFEIGSTPFDALIRLPVLTSDQVTAILDQLPA